MKGALASPGITVGFGGALVAVGMLVEEILLGSGPPDWWSLGRKGLAFVICAGVGIVTAKKPEWFTGLKVFDGPTVPRSSIPPGGPPDGP